MVLLEARKRHHAYVGLSKDACVPAPHQAVDTKGNRGLLSGRRWPLARMAFIGGVLTFIAAYITQVICFEIARENALIQTQREHHQIDSIQTFSLTLGSDFGAPKDAGLQNLAASYISHLSTFIALYNSSDLESVKIAEDIVAMSQGVEIDPFLVAAIAAVESEFKAQKTYPNGAFGIMQILPSTADVISKSIHPSLQSKPTSLRQKNILIGASYLKHLQSSFGSDLQTLLAAYNFGPTNVEKAGRKISRLPMHVQRYVNKVMTLLQEWKSIATKATPQESSDDLSAIPPR